MEDSIFTKIIKGEIPCHKVYEDEHAFAFLDINPKSEGHTLLVPKQQVGNLWEFQDDLLEHYIKTAKKIAERLQQVLSPKRVGLQVEGFGVPEHAHIHIVPLQQGFDQTTIDYVARQPADPDHEALAKMAEKLAF